MILCYQSIFTQGQVYATLFSPQASKTEKQKDYTAAGTNDPGLQAVADHQPQSKPQHYIGQHLIPSAHNNTPCTFYAGGVME